jgi:hypothetical protein
MRTAPAQFDHLTVAHLEVLLPAVICVERGHHSVLVAFASTNAETLVPPLIGRWLARSFGTPFLPAAANDCTLPGDAFYDKLTADFAGTGAFIAALVTGDEHKVSGALHDFERGGRLVRWADCGTVRAHVDLAHRNALIVFENIPGALMLDCGPVRAGKHTSARTTYAWYGFGRALASPDEIVGTLGYRSGRVPKREHPLHV